MPAVSEHDMGVVLHEESKVGMEMTTAAWLL